MPSVLVNFFRNLIILCFATLLTVNVLQFAQKSSTSYLSSLNIVHTKKILLWNSFFEKVDYGFGEGAKELFELNNCEVTDCFITHNRHLLPTREYDAIVFHGAQYQFLGDRPKERFDNQVYVYFSMESPANRPVSSSLNHFFNTTMTHRLDSDIFTGYFAIVDTSGKVVAPSPSPKWRTPVMDAETLETYRAIHKKKSKMGAWFVSNCYSVNAREVYVSQLQKYINIDIYGACGKLQCPRDNSEVCFKMLKNDYYFYLAFENSNCVDYVTEKALYPLQNDVIPVIYNGANSTKFLPPQSYIDASHMTPEKLAQTLKIIAESPEEYAKYFWWKKYYKAVELQNSFCDLCKYLHRDRLPKKIYSMVNWWHGNATNPICETSVP